MTSDMLDEPRIRITKMDAVRRQLTTAIRLWFADGDPVAIHTLLAAAHGILDVLYKRKGFKDLIFDTRTVRPERRLQWNRLIKDNANFFKHANKDPERVFVFSPFLNEFFIIGMANALGDMEEEYYLEECAFGQWLYVNRPDLLLKGPYNYISLDELEKLRSLSKAQFLAAYEMVYKGRVLPI